MDLQTQPRTRTCPPCAACRALRRRCKVNCLLAPYFPSHEYDNFARVHKLFGASNVIKMLQMVDEARREDAVKSMVYEAEARLRDPIYGCAGAIFCLQKNVEELQAELELTRAQILESQLQIDQLLKVQMDVCSLNQFTPINDINSYRLDLFQDGNTIEHDPDANLADLKWII
ncbi:LOB domain-containing protein 24-like [Tasmannia lanceolata]|uniref:LOB domain-containing protein 24-like n=1 Tax=Tasmannia lanceolata TaxID=3420 RepID=UPI004063405B